MVPPFRWRDMKLLLVNPDLKEIRDKMHLGERATWPKLSVIRLHCLVEIALKRGLSRALRELDKRGLSPKPRVFQESRAESKSRILLGRL